MGGDNKEWLLNGYKVFCGDEKVFKLERHGGWTTLWTHETPLNSIL